MDKKVLHVKLGDNLSPEAAGQIEDSLKHAFNDTDYKVLLTNQDTDVEVYDPTMMKELKTKIDEIHRAVANPIMHYDADKDAFTPVLPHLQDKEESL